MGDPLWALADNWREHAKLADSACCLQTAAATGDGLSWNPVEFTAFVSEIRSKMQKLFYEVEHFRGELIEAAVRLGQFETTTPAVSAYEAAVFHARAKWHCVREACEIETPGPASADRHGGLRIMLVRDHWQDIWNALARTREVPARRIAQRLVLESAVLHDIASEREAASESRVEDNEVETPGKHEAMVLRALLDAGHTMTNNAIEERLRKENPKTAPSDRTITDIVKRMISKGWCDRPQGPKSGAALTEKGKALAARYIADSCI